MADENRAPMRRRDLLSLIGAAGGAAAMYQAMTALGFAAESTYKGPILLDGDPKGASVLILGAGLAAVLPKAAAVFVDGRYTLQARAARRVTIGCNGSDPGF